MNQSPDDIPAPPEAGRHVPLGARFDGEGTNFSVFSEHATSVHLVLFADAGSDAPEREIELTGRDGPYRHVYVPGVRPGQLYGYRVYGPYEPAHGHRFNPDKVLLDPYARAIGRKPVWNRALFGYDIDRGGDDTSPSSLDSAPYAALGRVTQTPGDTAGPNASGGPGENRAHLNIPWKDTVIYETHVRGLTKLHPDVPDELRGTYAGLTCEPVLEHLRSLGVTTIQLQPVHAKFSERRLVENGLSNYWGYNSLSFFAPEPTYASNPDRAVDEFRAMVRSLHEAGFELLLDVVYNHTAEGSHLGPTLSFRGLDNRVYYKERPGNPRQLANFTGTGNTLDAGHPAVLQLIMDSLRYWAGYMNVDGFRFDLAPALARDPYQVDMTGAFFKTIRQDPVLSGVKLIAEPWDLGPGGYQAGAFPWPWAELNGRFRDTVRRFWRGDAGCTAEIATRVAGSSDLYQASGRSPSASINFVTSHDGFTLDDLVSYEQKHNEANLEGNRDGHEPTYSSNSGVEGPTDNESVLARREALKRSMLATLFVSQGVPMILGGDELGQTQLGNNNAYCQDNEITWYDWDLDRRDRSFLDFVRMLTALRREYPHFRRHTFLRGGNPETEETDAGWWHPEGRRIGHSDWHDPHLRTLGMVLFGGRSRSALLLVFNASEKEQTVVLPSFGDIWTVRFATRPEDVQETTPPGGRLSAGPLSTIVLASEQQKDGEQMSGSRQ